MRRGLLPQGRSPFFAQNYLLPARNVDWTSRGQDGRPEQEFVSNLPGRPVFGEVHHQRTLDGRALAGDLPCRRLPRSRAAAAGMQGRTQTEGRCERALTRCNSKARPKNVTSEKRPPRVAEAVSVCVRNAWTYFMFPLASMVIPPGPAFFFSSLVLRVPIALVRHSSALATSSLRAASLPQSTSALRR